MKKAFDKNMTLNEMLKHLKEMNVKEITRIVPMQSCFIVEWM